MATKAAEVGGANANAPKPVGAAAGEGVVCTNDGAAAPNGVPNAGAGAANPNAGAGTPKVVDDGGGDDAAALNPNAPAAALGAAEAAPGD